METKHNPKEIRGLRKAVAITGLGIASLVGSMGLSGCGPTLDKQDVSYVCSYLKKSNFEYKERYLQLYSSMTPEKYSKGIAVFNTSDEVKKDTITPEEVKENLPWRKDGKLTELDKAVIGIGIKMEEDNALFLLRAL